MSKKICVIYGGMSAEREVSLKSGKNIFDALKKNNKDVVLLDAGRDLAVKLAEIKPDICFNALHGTYGEDGCVQGLLETMGIPYTGSGVAASAIAFDKILAKHVFMDSGICTPKYKIIKKGDKTPPFMPCVVKPARQGSSVGISIVKKASDYAKAVEEAFKYDSKALAEEFISGKELTVPVMGDKIFPPIWIRPKEGFYDYAHKYTAGMTEYLLETELSPKRLATLGKIAGKVYDSCGCRSMARVDFIATDRNFYAIEINTLPGMTATSLVPKSASKSGYTFEGVVELIASSAGLDKEGK